MRGSTVRWLVTVASLLVLGAGNAWAQKKLVVYTANESTLNDLVFSAFKKETGIEVEPVAAGSGVLVRRLQAEKARPLGDIIWGVSRSLLQTNKALFEPYVSKNKDATPAEYRDPDDLWIGNNLHLLVILQNTKLVPADRGPKSWADLLDPKWKGKIAFTDPANSGSAYATVTMLVDLWGGGDAGWKKVGALFKNLKVLNRSSLVFQGVGNGEYPLGISLEYAGPLWAAGGAPVKVVYPSDGTTFSMEGVGIVKGGSNTDQAKAFVDYINRKDVRETILKATFRRPTRADVDLTKLPGNMPPLSEVKLIKYDEEGWTEKRTKTMEQIKDAIQDSR
ncbi:MAG: extracellular solute-binding protein [Reyranella sp.]|uniref:extracellular solute-binding protein n=1 Tax=Reyranella sp. TaxID=1929291 RepID=UPI001AC99053|nr:extracellular solute-binding protein [Reyranella sp.]MBN9089454.1 extracellular solute-binding protein [Reyranella sp.]